ncbi:MAG: hypothetical protein Q4C77_06165 [Eubacteriales bacterium]|nr:hypothetical protein [Eubacteriales bacterium]
MGFSPAAYSMIFDTIDTYTEKKDIVRALKLSTGKKKKYLDRLSIETEIMQAVCVSEKTAFMDGLRILLHF